MTDSAELTRDVKRIALEAGADLVGIAPVERFAHAPEGFHPKGIFSHTRSVIALGVRMLRGALKTIEEGSYWQAYNCDSYQYLNEILAPHLLRKVILHLERHGYTSVPLHNPFAFHSGRPVRPGGTRPDGGISLRVIGCAAGLGELGRSKLFLTPRFGPRQRMFGILTDAELVGDPQLPPGSVCDDCGACTRGCPGGAMDGERTAEVRIGEYTYTHVPLDCARCAPIHQGWDPKYSPFVGPENSRENPPHYFKFLQHRFRHQSTCGGRGCVRACVDHLEKAGRLTETYRTPMIEGEQWVIDDPPA